MSDLAERLGRLPQGQRSRLLGRMRNQMTAGVGRRVELARADHGPRSRSSFQQEQMWFVDKLGAGKARNNIALSIALGGPLDRAALHEALNAVVARHQVLHSKLVEIDGVPWQEPVPSFVLGVQSTDLSGSEDAERELAELTAATASAPFDLAAGPPVRAHLVRLAEDRHVLLWVVHHIAWDPGSTRIFTEELTASYAAAAAGKRPEAPRLAVEYADFAAWQRAKLENDEHGRALAAKWRQILAGAAATEVMPDHPRGPETKGDGRGLKLNLDQKLLDRLTELADTGSTTVFTTLLAAFNALLRHWTRTEDVVVGTASASRPHPDLEQVIGCFVQMITLRTEVTDGLTFRELVTRTAASVMDSFTSSELPFEQVVEAVRPVRDPLRHPLFQIEFTSLGRWGTHRAQAADVEFTMDQLHDGAAKFDMSFLVGENDGLELSLEYNTSLYRHGTASALLAAFKQVLEQVAENPDLRVGDISLVEEPPPPGTPASCPAAARSTRPPGPPPSTAPSASGPPSTPTPSPSGTAPPGSTTRPSTAGPRPSPTGCATAASDTATPSPCAWPAAPRPSPECSESSRRAPTTSPSTRPPRPSAPVPSWPTPRSATPSSTRARSCPYRWNS